MRVLVSGAGGFIGRRCVRALITRGIAVDAIVRHPATAPAGAREIVADLLDAETMRRAVAESGATHLLHLAWCAVPQTFWTDRANVDWIAASLDLVRAFYEEGGKRVTGVGTCAEYRLDGALQREDTTPIEPATLYGAAKAAVAGVLPHVASAHGGSAVWCRLFYLYGSGEPPEKFVSRALAATVTGDEVVLTEPQRRLDFMHADDAAAGIVTALLGDIEGTLNIASGAGITSLDILDAIESVTGKRPAARIDERRPMPDVVADVQRLRAVPGWTPARGLADGLREHLQGTQAVPA